MSLADIMYTAPEWKYSKNRIPGNARNEVILSEPAMKTECIFVYRLTTHVRAQAASARGKKLRCGYERACVVYRGMEIIFRE